MEDDDKFVSKGGDFAPSEKRTHFKRDRSNSEVARDTKGKWMDVERANLIAYEYLCHLEEARLWIGACIHEELPKAVDLETNLRNGVIVAKLGMFFQPDVVKAKKIFDMDQSRYQSDGLHFRHTDNIMQWLNSLRKVGLPEIFYPETSDLYDKKNLPKVIYCVHALSHYLFKKGLAPKIQDLVGKAQFTDEEIAAMDAALKTSGVTLPQFGKINGVLAKELSDDDVALHQAILDVNVAIDKGVSTETLEKLHANEAQLHGICDDMQNEYQAALFQTKHAKMMEYEAKTGKKAGMPGAKDAEEGTDVYDVCLTQQEIQETMEGVNKMVAIRNINAAVDSGSVPSVLATLQKDDLSLRFVNADLAARYTKLLAGAKQEKFAAAGNNDHHAAIFAINEAVVAGNADATLTTLKAPHADLHTVEDTSHENYQSALAEAREAKKNAYENLIRSTDSAEADAIISRRDDPSSTAFYSRALTKEEIQVEVLMVNNPQEKIEVKVGDDVVQMKPIIGSECVRVLQSVMPLATSLSAEEIQLWVAKANAEAKAIKEREERELYLASCDAQIQKIQAWWRGKRQRKAYLERLDYLNKQENSAIKLQAMARMMKERKKYNDRKKILADNTAAVVKIQAFVRGYQARKKFAALTSDENLPPSTLRNFLHLLEQSYVDFSEELELQRLKQQIVKAIRDNQELEKNINLMDIKIGLLVKNRITLDDVVASSKRLKKNTTMGDLNDVQQHGLKALNKETRERLENYQHMFYLLQTRPTYLAKTIFAMPGIQATKFMQNVVLALYSYAQHSREEFLLLNLFKHAIHSEMDRVDTPQDLVTGNPLVISMVVSYVRGARDREFLKSVLHVPIKALLDEKDLNVQVNPVDIYKAMINKMEAESGQASDLPYDVPTDEAFKHETVKAIVMQRLQKLKTLVLSVLTYICDSLTSMPYGIRYISMTLRRVLKKKFPDASEEEILKVAGNLIYYRYMNPAVTGPEMYDVVDLDINETLSVIQRRNLMEVSKMLTRIASGKLYADEDPHLQTLNPFMKESYDMIRAFFDKCSTVEEPEDKFNMDQYSDITMMAKPTVFMSPKEIFQTHALIKEHLDEVCPEPTDPLHAIIKVMDDAPGPDNAETGEISLQLTPKFQVEEEKGAESRLLFVRTKRLVMTVIRSQPGKSVTAILDTPATAREEESHKAYMRKRNEIKARKESERTNDEKDVTPIVPDDSDLEVTLEETKAIIRANLELLEKEKLVTKKKNYQELLSAIAKDIRNQRAYRLQRKVDIQKLGVTLSSLQKKGAFCDSQIEQFQLYIKGCLDNLAQAQGKQKKRFRDLFSRSSNKGSGDGHQFGSFRYTAAKLFEKGVLLELEGVPKSARKNAVLEISSNEVGVFDIQATLMGIKMEETVELRLDELLQMQYEGVKAVDMFDSAKVNINLLIFLLNKKFYNKVK